MVLTELRDTSHVIHVACVSLCDFDLVYFRIFLNFYVLCVKYQSDGVITTWISSLFVCFPKSVGHKWIKSKLEC